MILVETFRKPDEPVRKTPLSTFRTHRHNRTGKPNAAVFPVVHTPYGYYERI